MSAVGLFSEAFYTTDLSQKKDQVYLDRNGAISIGSPHVCRLTASCRGWQNPHLMAVSRRIHNLLSEKGSDYEPFKKHLSSNFKGWETLRGNIKYIDSACKRGNQKFKQVQESYFWCLILKIVNCIRFFLCCGTIGPYPRIFEDTVNRTEVETFDYSRAKHSLLTCQPRALKQILKMDIPRLEIGLIDKARFSLGTKVFELSYNTESGKFDLYLTYTTRHIAPSEDEFQIVVKCKIVDLGTQPNAGLQGIQELTVTHTVRDGGIADSDYDNAGIILDPGHTYAIVDEHFDPVGSSHDIKTYPQLACFKIGQREVV